MSSSSSLTTKNPGTFISGASFLRGSRSYISKLAFYLIVLAIIFNAPERINIGIFEFLLHKSPTRLFRLLKGLSYIPTAIYGCLATNLRAVTAPMDLPQTPILVTFSLALMCMTTSSRSFH